MTPRIGSDREMTKDSHPYCWEHKLPTFVFVCVCVCVCVAYMMLKIAAPVGCSLGLLHMFKCASESVARVNN